MEVEDAEFISDQIAYVTNAIEKIAEGGLRGPGGLEGLAVAIAGWGMECPLSTSINHVAGAIDNLAEAVRESGR
jgi:hypothetical protein